MTVLKAAALLLLLSCVSAGAGPAFPGATGFGASADGWRGGKIVAVTNLADSGRGSLRACAKNEGKPRVCVFRVGGTIVLKKPIRVGSNLYIAGQTAPGDGIQLRNDGSAKGPLIIKNVHDVVVRFLKIRPGPSAQRSANVDAVTVENARRVYLGNLSMSFATDETFNIHVSSSTAADITLADSILSFSLDRSTHIEKRHSKGALICSDQGKKNKCGRISIVRNLFAHHRDRNPDIKATSIGPVEVINNVFYNPISQFGEFYDLLGNARIAYVGNIALSGPSTINKVPEAVQVFEWNNAAKVSLWAQDNKIEVAAGCWPRKTKKFNQAAKNARKGQSGWTLSTKPMSSENTLWRVLSRAGDRLPNGKHRDSLDKRAIQDVRKCTGVVIDTVDQVGGWPTVPKVKAQPDKDRDGFPDWWEKAVKRLNPNLRNNPWAPSGKHNLSEIELWLAKRAGDVP